MSQPLVDNLTRSFLVGCPRSGTTALQNLLTQRGSLFTFPESHFFCALRNRRRLYRLLLIPRPQRDPNFKGFLDATDPVQGSAISRTRWPITDRTYVRRFIRHLDDLAMKSQTAGWIEKTPDHIHCIDFISRAVPAAKFIHLVRDPRSTIASLFDVAAKYPGPWNGPYSVDLCIAKWKGAAQLSERYLRNPRHAVVLYDDFVRESEAICDRLLQFLNVPRSTHGAAVESLALPHEQWKSEARKSVREASIQTDKFDTLFNERQREKIDSETRGLFQRFQSSGSSIPGA